MLHEKTQIDLNWNTVWSVFTVCMKYNEDWSDWADA